MFYFVDPLNPRWTVVLTHKRTKLENDDICDSIEDTLSFSRGVATLDMEEEGEDYLMFIHDDCDGEYVALDDREKKKRKKK